MGTTNTVKSTILLQDNKRIMPGFRPQMPRRELSCNQRCENEVLIEITITENMDIDPSDSDADEQAVSYPRALLFLGY